MNDTVTHRQTWIVSLKKKCHCIRHSWKAEVDIWIENWDLTRWESVIKLTWSVPTEAKRVKMQTVWLLGWCEVHITHEL